MNLSVNGNRLNGGYNQIGYSNSPLIVPINEQLPDLDYLLKMGANGQQYCLRWNDHRSNLLAVFDQLLQTEAFTDVTLACGGASIKCHKMVLAACSTYFQSLFLENTCSHPIVVFKDIQYAEIRAILEYMYRGEVNVEHEHLPSLLKVAAALKVKGLVDEDGQAEPEVVPRIPPPPPPKTQQPTSVQANTKRPESPPTSEASNQRPSYMYRNSIVNNSNPDLSLPVWSPLMMPLPMGVYESAMASLANNGPKRKRASGSEDSGRPNVVGQQGVTVEGPPLQAPPSRQEGHISDLSLQNYSYQRPQYEFYSHFQLKWENWLQLCSPSEDFDGVTPLSTTLHCNMKQLAKRAANIYHRITKYSVSFAPTSSINSSVLS